MIESSTRVWCDHVDRRHHNVCWLHFVGVQLAMHFIGVQLAMHFIEVHLDRLERTDEYCFRETDPLVITGSKLSFEESHGSSSSV